MPSESTVSEKSDDHEENKPLTDESVKNVAIVEVQR